MTHVYPFRDMASQMASRRLTVVFIVLASRLAFHRRVVEPISRLRLDNLGARNRLVENSDNFIQQIFQNVRTKIYRTGARNHDFRWFWTDCGHLEHSSFNLHIRCETCPGDMLMTRIGATSCAILAAINCKSRLNFNGGTDRG